MPRKTDCRVRIIPMTSTGMFRSGWLDEWIGDGWGGRSYNNGCQL